MIKLKPQPTLSKFKGNCYTCYNKSGWHIEALHELCIHFFHMPNRLSNIWDAESTLSFYATCTC